MSEMLFSIDKALFHFINTTLANPLFDATMPWFTDWHKSGIGVSIVVALWLLLMWKGGKKGRVVGLLIIPLILITDPLSSSVVKMIFARPRPCHVVDGVQMVETIHLLVDCGSGYSFPSSHAVNNFALALLLSYHYRKWTWAFMLYAFMMGISRVIVGVHYPSDVFAGALLGMLCAYTFIVCWNAMGKRFPVLDISSNRTTEQRAQRS